MTFLHSYGLALGQWMNVIKSHFYTSDDTPLFNMKIKEVLSCPNKSIPFQYLGVPIFKGALKSYFLQSLTYKIWLKLSLWKGKILSMMGTIQLVNFVEVGTLAYSF